MLKHSCGISTSRASVQYVQTIAFRSMKAAVRVRETNDGSLRSRQSRNWPSPSDREFETLSGQYAKGFYRRLTDRYKGILLAAKARIRSPIRIIEHDRGCHRYLNAASFRGFN